MSNLEKVKQLRQATGAGFKDCNSALKESKDNIDKAIEILRIKGISKASKKMSREAKEGVIAVSSNKESTSLIEINCETDFVAKNQDFIDFVKEVSQINNISKSDLAKLKISKMQNNQTVDENLISMIAKIGEKITIGRLKTIEHKGAKNYIYQHTTVKDNLSKLAVVVLIETNDNSEKINLFGKQLSMHIAASNPISLNEENIDKSILKKEEELIFEELANSGKPKDIVKKISTGKLKKFIEENSLLTQQWVMEPKKKVNDIINELKINDIEIRNFFRIKIGE